MRKRYFLDVDLKEKSFKVEESDVQRKFIATVDNFSMFANAYMPIEKLFTVNGRLFFQRINGVFGEYVNGEIVEKGDFSNVSNIFAIGKGATEKVALFTDERCIDIDTGRIYNVPIGVIENAFGRLFSASGNVIKISNDSDLTDFSGGKYIKTNKQYGDVIDMRFFDEKLYVFTERAIYTLTEVNDLVGCKLEKLILPEINIKRKSVQTVGDKIAFVSGNSICTLKNDTLTFTTFTVEDKQIYSSTVTDGEYVLKLDSDTVFYNFITDKISVYDLGYFNIFGEYAVSPLEVGIYTFNRQNTGEKIVLKVDFDSAYKKTITELSLYLETPIKLTVQGDFTKRVYFFNQGYNVKKLNLTSTDFSMQFDCEKAYSVKNLKIKYTTNGGD